MSKLTAEIKSCGLCSKCSTHQVTAISEKEAKAIREKVKQACIEAVEKERHPESQYYGTYEDGLDEAIKAIQEVE